MSSKAAQLKTIVLLSSDLFHHIIESPVEKVEDVAEKVEEVIEKTEEVVEKTEEVVKKVEELTVEGKWLLSQSVSECSP